MAKAIKICSDNSSDSHVYEILVEQIKLKKILTFNFGLIFNIIWWEVDAVNHYSNNMNDPIQEQQILGKNGRTVKSTRTFQLLA